jgi:hypothetical protein
MEQAVGDVQPLPGLKRPGSLVRDVFARPGVPSAGAQPQYEAHARIEGHRRLQAIVWFDSQSGRRVVAQVDVAPSDPSRPSPDGVTVEAIRAVRLGKIQGEVSEIIAREEKLGRLPARLADGFRRVPRPGRRERPRQEYAAFAAEYEQLLGSPTPIKELARRHHISESSARAILNRARHHNLLTRSPPGRAGGELTELARQLLNEAKEG